MKIFTKKISLFDSALTDDFYKLISEVFKAPNSLPWDEITAEKCSGFLKSFTDSKASDIYFAYANETLISAGIISIESQAAFIELLCIHPDYHGQGLGPRMLELFDQFTVSHQLKSIRARISKVKRIEDFYLRSNFIIQGDYYIKNITP